MISKTLKLNTLYGNTALTCFKPINATATLTCFKTIDATATKVSAFSAASLPASNVDEKDPSISMLDVEFAQLHKSIPSTLPQKPDIDRYTPLTQAVVDIDYEGVTKYAKDGINKSDGYGKTPLTHAVEQAYLPMLHHLMSLPNADVNLHDANGDTPLTVAINSVNEEMVITLLHKYKANPNLNDRRNNSPLMLALQSRNYHNTAKVAQYGADLDQPDRIDYLPLSYCSWFLPPEFQNCLIVHGANTIFYLEEQLRSLLAHAWGMSGTTEIPRTGKSSIVLSLDLPRQGGLYMLRAFLPTFLKGNPHFTEIEVEWLTDIVENAIGNGIEDGHVERINDKKPLLIFGGYFNEETGMAQTIAFGIVDGAIFVCNKGAGKDPKYAITYHKIDQAQITVDLIEKLETSYQSIAEINAMFAGLKFPFFHGMARKPSKKAEGTDSWGAAKLAMCALFHMLKKPDSVYKDFVMGAKDFYLNRYLSDSPIPSSELLAKVAAKHQTKLAAKKERYKAIACVALTALNSKF